MLSKGISRFHNQFVFLDDKTHMFKMVQVIYHARQLIFLLPLILEAQFMSLLVLDIRHLIII